MAATVQEVPVVTRPVDWRDGTARRGELEMLRGEVRELRDLTRAVLMCLVGKDRMLTWKIEARIEDHMDRERHSPPLRQVGIQGNTADELRSRYGIYTLRELVRELPRERVAAIPGIGAARMRRLDEAVIEHDLEWVTEADATLPIGDPESVEREAVAV